MEIAVLLAALGCAAGLDNGGMFPIARQAEHALLVQRTHLHVT